MGKIKFKRGDREFLQSIASKLPVFPMMDQKGEFILCKYPTSGAELINQGITTVDAVVTHKGPNKSKHTFETILDVKPEETYFQTGYLLSDPFNYLYNAIKKHGVKFIDQASKDYMKLNEKSQKKLAELQAKKNDKSTADIQKQPEIPTC